MHQPRTSLHFGNHAGQDVDEYVEYKRIVGDDDGGELFSPEQYEQYKKRVSPMRIQNRLYVSFVSPTGMDCKLIGPETRCFCGHYYRQHMTDFEKIPDQRPVKQPCRSGSCSCRSYNYLPSNGSQPIRCKCKHLPDEHSVGEPNPCDRAGCSCHGFSSTFTCGCGQPVNTHFMVIETKQERASRGHPVGQDTIYQAMGGITGFSSLLEGYARLDPSGMGAPGQAFLNQEITSSDHPFLRTNVKAIRAHQQASGVQQTDSEEMRSAVKRPGESDMDYFERRYQERQKAQRALARETKGMQTLAAASVPRKGLTHSPASRISPRVSSFSNEQAISSRGFRGSTSLPKGAGFLPGNKTSKS